MQNKDKCCIGTSISFGSKCPDHTGSECDWERHFRVEGWQVRSELRAQNCKPGCSAWSTTALQRTCIAQSSTTMARVYSCACFHPSSPSQQATPPRCSPPLSLSLTQDDVPSDSGSSNACNLTDFAGEVVKEHADMLHCKLLFWHSAILRKLRQQPPFNHAATPRHHCQPAPSRQNRNWR